MKRILNIGVDETLLSKHDIKIRKLFNGLTFFGFFTALIQVVPIIQQDNLAVLFHSLWGVYCLVALFLHHLGYFRIAKFSLVFAVLVFGTLAAARIGSEYYPHIGSFGIIGASFVFFDIKKEWGFLLFFVLLHAAGIGLVESDVLQNKAIQFSNPEFLKTSTIIGTALFISLEILTILKVSSLAEKEIISDLKESNQELKQISEEKTVMLQEIHHRVKNNLQVVISLIKLQTKSIDDQKTINTFEELRMRLISIARMHEMMYLSERLNKINFSNYVQELCDMIIDTTDTRYGIDLTVETNVDHLSAEGIVPLALILNELITNSIKHSFDDQSSAGKYKIDVQFNCSGTNRYILLYSDNGRWKEKERDSNGFGLELIELLTEQLEGTFDRKISDEGTKYTFNLVV